MKLENNTDTAIEEVINLATKEPKKSEYAWYLEHIASDKKDVFFIQIKKFPFYIGRNVDCELFMPFKYVSRYHAQIVNEKDILRIVDLDSVNGIYINRKRIDKSTLLKDGDILHLNANFHNSNAFRIVSQDTLKIKDVQNDSDQAEVHGKDKTQLLYSIKKRTQFLDVTECSFTVGLPLYLEFQGKEKKFLKTRIFSWKKGTSLTVEVSGAGNLKIKEGANCAVRFFYDGKVYGFLTKIKEIEASEKLRLSLIYPLNFSYISYRRTTRYKTNLKARIRKSIKGVLINCTVVDISLSGLRVSFPYMMEEVINGESLLTIVDILNDIRVKKVHEIITPSDYRVGFQIISFGGLSKKKRYEEILDFHAPLGDISA